MKKNLKIISKKYKTTKKMMGFISIYEKYLSEYRNKKINLLEIGVENGESLKMFSEYFPKANLVGLDIFKKEFSIKKTELFKGDQADIGILAKIVNKYKKFDIIIDDGSHINSDIKKSFNYLFSKLKYGGIYVIEDLQTSYISNWGGDGVNLNNNVGGIAFATAKGDETANTKGNIIFHSQVVAATPITFDMNNAVILGTNQSIAVDVVEATTYAYATIWGYYK